MRVSSLIASGGICGPITVGQVVIVRGGVLVAGLDPRPVRRRAGRLVRAAPQHLRAAHLRVRLQLLRRARLADAGLADEHHQPAVTGDGVVERLPQPLQLLLASDEDAERQPVEDVGVGVRRRLAAPGRRARAPRAHRPRWRAAPPDPSPAGAGRCSSSSCGQDSACHDGATGGVLMCWLITAVGLSLTNGGRPVIISYSMQPSE